MRDFRLLLYNAIHYDKVIFLLMVVLLNFDDLTTDDKTTIQPAKFSKNTAIVVM